MVALDSMDTAHTISIASLVDVTGHGRVRRPERVERRSQTIRERVNIVDRLAINYISLGYFNRDIAKILQNIAQIVLKRLIL